jgi:hypothetical protein
MSLLPARETTALLGLLLAASAIAVCAASPAEAAEAAMAVDIPAGQFKAVRMRNLPKDAVMAVAVESSGQVVVSLLNEQDAHRFPKPQDPVFVGSLDQRLSFTVTIPADGTYFLVLDNRQGGEVRKVKFAIRAQRGASPRPQAPPTTPSPITPNPGSKPDKL